MPEQILTVLPAATRLSLRGGSEVVDAADAAFGLTLPRAACRASTAGDRAALWLGPDEWLLVVPEGEETALVARLEAALANTPHAVVDISHRQVAFAISGPEAEAVLNTGCPLDLSPEAFPVGMCTRTILGKCQIVLWRTAPDTFRVEVWRSFAAYVRQFLHEAALEFHV
ncbi:Sarcosine oxidase gamma subunit [Rhodovastum atsumiense]|uniref:Sarcosine oxidase subunit gamma family protein n=1 Tax=Rhodovastum atsumiense TaxID=504468 RepID=A0A5M6J0J1_9PROT|nr:sarcosine oxidase subunit gamma [Rhodovastum atsumiense]KAA5614116.1 sarcosine oxidase subunit gamma family protein [Rhodovastum atsumiense]CAH2598961.1 Sarcosine oxidase gamma subunit [Rhodovastum atsumiense]